MLNLYTETNTKCRFVLLKLKKIKFYEKSIDKHYLKYYNKSCRKTNASL